MESLNNKTFVRNLLSDRKLSKCVLDRYYCQVALCISLELVCMTFKSVCLPVCCLSFCLPVCCLSICLSVYPFAVCLSVCCLSVSQSVHPSVCLSVCLVCIQKS